MARGGSSLVHRTKGTRPVGSTLVSTGTVQLRLSRQHECERRRAVPWHASRRSSVLWPFILCDNGCQQNCADPIRVRDAPERRGSRFQPFVWRLQRHAASKKASTDTRILTCCRFPSVNVIALCQMVLTVACLWLAKQANLVSFPSFSSNVFSQVRFSRASFPPSVPPSLPLALCPATSMQLCNLIRQRSATRPVD